MASGKGTKIHKRLQSGVAEGQGVADTVSSSRLLLEGPSAVSEWAKSLQASSSMLGRSRLPAPSCFCLACS